MSGLFPLSVTGAATRRRGKRLVGPVDFDWDGQGTQVVLGPNGSGKTTLLRLLHGIARLHEGEISWACGTAAARNAQAFVFQRPVMLRRTVGENLAYPLTLRGVARAEARGLAEGWADRVGLAEMIDRPASVLSGGEQQKLAIARALIVEPELVFLDEPSASLDGRATREIEAILSDAVEGGTRVVLATHDMGQARRLASRVVFMLHGRVHETGPAHRFFDAPETAEARAFLKGDIVE
ncbi:MAG: ATP-binding cassette domain-containing protein [Litoreibacter sp.]|nr:ATP-binding cassette domain-containing protein [Litoreibacter sp.]MCY4336573.1 ATP-binding cassette domain-containing protein [Litoreibacter sp.]